MNVGIITISDRAYAGVYEDLGGPALKKVCLALGWPVMAEALVPDEMESIQTTVQSFCHQQCALILTTGGTGLDVRDVTPEAIRAIMRMEVPGFGERMRQFSFEKTPNALLSRGFAAVVEHSLVLALPGKPQGAVECLESVLGALDHAVKVVHRLPTSC